MNEENFENRLAKTKTSELTVGEHLTRESASLSWSATRSDAHSHKGKKNFVIYVSGLFSTLHDDKEPENHDDAVTSTAHEGKNCSFAVNPWESAGSRPSVRHMKDECFGSDAAEKLIKTGSDRLAISRVSRRRNVRAGQAAGVTFLGLSCP